MKVLIADDEPIERMVVGKKCKQLFQDTLEIYEAVNGREVMQLHEEEQFDILLLDIEMPGISGLEAAEAIRQKDHTCEIIFLTAFDEFGYAKRAISVKALDYLLKPVDEQELYATMQEAIQRKTVGKKKDKVCQKKIEYTGDEETVDNVKIRMITQMLKDYLEEAYVNDISLQDVAAHFHYSDAYFCKIFKQCFRKGFIVYLSELRVNKAKILLQDISINVKEISQKVGYHDSNYFTKVFKRIEGVTPSEYRMALDNYEK